MLSKAGESIHFVEYKQNRLMRILRLEDQVDEVRTGKSL